MAFDRTQAEGTLVEILDQLNGDQVVGMGVRLPGDLVATTCQCLPRPTGSVILPDPDAPSLPVLVRLRKLRSQKAASAVVAAADPFSGLALLRSAAAAGLDVPDELNPDLSADELIAEVAPAAPALAPPLDGPAFLFTPERRWVEGTVTGSTLSLQGEADLRGARAGTPVFDERGQVVGLVGACDEAGLEARLCLLAEHLPGWALRMARAAEAARE